MAFKKFQYVPFVTKTMTARHPCLSEPDTEGEYADGKYKTEAAADDNYTAEFQAAIQAVADESFPGKKDVHLPWKLTKDGRVAFIFKSPKKQPELLNSENKALGRSTAIRSGDRIRVAGVIAAWEAGVKRGISLWPDAVKVISYAKRFDAVAAFGDDDA